MRALEVERIRARLVTANLGRELVALAETGSTMDVLAELAAAGAPEGTVVLADRQTAGRGRFGRPWWAPAGTALLMSVLFRPPPPAERVGQVPMALALGALEGLEAVLRPVPPLGLKWPNDLECRGLKLAGLLAEADWGPEGRAVLRVGLGLNLSQAPDALPPGAVSLDQLLDRLPDRATLAAAILNATERHYLAWRDGAELLPRWRARLTTLGQTVTAATAEGSLTGLASGVAADGALILRLADGREMTLRAADVSLRPAREGQFPPEP